MVSHHNLLISEFMALKCCTLLNNISQYIKEHIIKMRQEFGIIRGCLTRFGIRM